MLTIYKNAIRCNICGDVVVSKGKNKSKCSCGSCGAFGGSEFLGRFGTDWKDVSFVSKESDR